MAQEKKQKKIKAEENSISNKVAETIKLMANTPPISNEEIIKRSKKRQK